MTSLYALAIHGGAGTIAKDMGAQRRRVYEEALEAILSQGRLWLAQGVGALEAVERVVHLLEDEPLFNAGRGANFNAEGEHELDASIMDGRRLTCGAVAGVRTVKHPIALARAVMEKTPYLLLAGAGAEAFADRCGVDRVAPSYFSTEARRQHWLKVRSESSQGSPKVGMATVGAVARDQEGNLAAATSTGGLSNKHPGRVGDTAIIGAGTYADNRTAAVSATGVGEEFIRRCAAFDLCQRLRLTDASLENAAREVVEGLPPGSGGVIAVGRDGRIAMPFTSEGMYRGAADAHGRFDVAIWD